MASSQTININHRAFDASVLRVLELHADFTCENCGKCCRGEWGITLDGPDQERLRTALSSDGLSREEIEHHFVPNPTKQDPQRVRFACENSQCAFCRTRPDGSSYCKIHQSHGHKIIPAVCQSFPRNAVGTPAGVYLTLTYTCPTAARLLLKADALREVSPRQIYQSHPELFGTSFGHTVKAPQFSRACRPPWSVFDYFWRWTPEWMALPLLSPAQALYGLGRVVGFIESIGSQAAELATMIDLLDQAVRVLPQTVKHDCAKIEPVTELGVIYLDTLLNIMQEIHFVPPALIELWEGVNQGNQRLDRVQLIAAYDQIVRPCLAEFEQIERNYIASRLYANPLAYRGNWLRTGYFVVVLSLIALRFSVLAICLREGVKPDENIWLRAAALADHLLIHNNDIPQRFLEILEQRIQASIEDLALPAIF